MPKFSGCQYGPMHLRVALREGWERGERLIGWTPARLKPTNNSADFLVHGLMHVPGLQVVALFILAARSRFIVLTDRRLLILPVARDQLKDTRRRVTLPVGAMDMRDGGRSVLSELRVFRASHAGHDLAFTITPKKKSRPQSRLLKGLALLTADEG